MGNTDIEGCKMCEMFSDMPLMYGMAAVVVGVAVSLVSVVVVVVGHLVFHQIRSLL